LSEVVALADQRRRAQGAMRGLLRLAPISAAVVLLAAVLSRLIGFSIVVPLALLGAAVVVLGAFAWIQTRRRQSTDAIAAAVDRDAALAGELRSAHWFEASGSADDWAQFHIDRAEARAKSVDWAGLYPPVRGARSWALTATLAAAAIVLSVGVPARRVALATTASDGAPAAVADPLSAELRAKLNALLAQMELGKLTAEEARANLAELKDLLAKIDPKLQDKLDEMLKNAELAADAAKGKEFNGKELAEGKNASGMPQDMKKALEDLAQRLNKNDQNQTEGGNPENTQGSEQNGESGQPGEKGQGQSTDMKATASQGSMQMVRESASDAAAGKMMMGGGMMGGDSKSGVGGNKTAETGAAEALLVAQALKKELIEANDDIQGKNVQKEDIRRKTEQGKSTLGFTHVAPTAFERSRADAPPPVPEARRPLLQQYFIRK
jgi:hypothetical protein